MPDCVVLHFEQGLKVKMFEDLDFEGENGRYVLSQFIQYKKNPDHFVCWTKEPKGTWHLTLSIFFSTSKLRKVSFLNTILVWRKINFVWLVSSEAWKGSNRYF